MEPPVTDFVYLTTDIEDEEGWYASAEEFGYQPEQMRGFNRGRNLPTVENPFRARADNLEQSRDFLQASDVVLIRPWVADLLRKKEVTGWRSFPAIVLRPYGTLTAEEMVGIAVLGKGGRQDLTKGIKGLRTREDGTIVPSGMDGLYFDPAGWDGSDLFKLADGDGEWLLATARVPQILRDAGVTGWMSIPIREISF